MASKRKQPVESVHDRDRIIVRLPDGMRDRLAAFAEANGRSMTAEVVAAIEQHLQGIDRVTQLWELFEKHRENLEAIPHIWDAVEYLEDNMDQVMGHHSRPLRTYRDEMEQKARKAAELRKDVDEGRKRTQLRRLGEHIDEVRKRTQRLQKLGERQKDKNPTE